MVRWGWPRRWPRWQSCRRPAGGRRVRSRWRTSPTRRAPVRVACIGSRLVSGAIAPGKAFALRDDAGTTLAEAMAAQGRDPRAAGPAAWLNRVGTLRRTPRRAGPLARTQRSPVGVASAIWPHGRYRLDFCGQGNHAEPPRWPTGMIRCSPTRPPSWRRGSWPRPVGSAPPWDECRSIRAAPTRSRRGSPPGWTPAPRPIRARSLVSGLIARAAGRRSGDGVAWSSRRNRPRRRCISTPNCGTGSPRCSTRPCCPPEPARRRDPGRRAADGDAVRPQSDRGVSCTGGVLDARRHRRRGRCAEEGGDRACLRRELSGLRQLPFARLPPRAARAPSARSGLLGLARRHVRGRRRPRPRQLLPSGEGDLRRDAAGRLRVGGGVPLPASRPDGTPYADPNAMAEAVIEAARAVGLRICLLHTRYAAPASVRRS